MKQRFITLIIILILIVSCSTVKTRYKLPNKNIPESLSSSSKQNKEIIKPKKFEYRNRYRDTSEITLDNVSREKISLSDSKKNNSESRFDIALKEYDKDNLTTACSEFEELAKNIQQDDKDFYDLQFYRIECLIVNEKFNDAESYLLDWLSFDKLPVNIREKMLVRLGQVYCIINKPAEADKTFEKFRKEFPSSQLLPFANCSVLKY